jgi:glutamine phosphoribosylpyrophosphate amidotransferase
MCGIAGLLLHEPGPVGESLVKMCEAMRHRGADSTGFALYGEPDTTRLIVRARHPDASRALADAEHIADAVRDLGGDLHDEITHDDQADASDRFLRLQLRYTGDIKRLAIAIETAAPGIEIQSVGHSLEIVKDAGGAAEVDARHHISRFRGTHGLGHVRLATESITAVAYGHPFWAEPFPDVSIVHNGQLTNYYTLRRLLEHDGFRFQTGNDSELIAVYLADKMSRGQTFYEALKDSVYELDGCFAYLLSMPDVIGSAKDMFAIKSIVVANVGGDTAMATEEQAIRAVYTDELDDTLHPDPRSVFVWERSGRVLQEIV